MVIPTEQSARETVMQQVPLEQQFALQQASRGMNQPDPTMQLMQQAQEMRFMSNAAAQRAELVAHEIGGLNSAYDRAPKPGGAVKGVALAGVGAGLGAFAGSKVVDFAENFKNAEKVTERVGDIIKGIKNNEQAEKAIQQLGKEFGKNSKIFNAASDHIQQMTEAAENNSELKDFAVETAETAKQRFAEAAKTDVTKGLGSIVNNIREKVGDERLGKVGGAVVAVCAVTGAVLGVRHLMKENDARMSRMEAIDQAIQQKSAEHQMYADTALNNAIGAQQAETMLASTWQQRMAERGIAPRSQDASWVDRTSQQAVPQLSAGVGV